MTETRLEPTKTNFFISKTTNEKKITINSYIDHISLKNYSAILVVHDKEGKIITLSKNFEGNRTLDFKEVDHPIFCLIYDKKIKQSTKDDFITLISHLKQLVGISSPNNGLSDYYSSHEKFFSETFSKIVQYFSKEEHRGKAISLLKFDFGNKVCPPIKIHDFEIEAIKQQINARIETLEEIKAETPELIKKYIIEKLSYLISQLINYRENGSNTLTRTFTAEIKAIDKEIEEIKKQILAKNKVIIEDILQKLETFEKRENIDLLIAYSIETEGNFTGKSIFKEGIEGIKKMLLKENSTQQFLNTAIEPGIKFIEKLRTKEIYILEKLREEREIEELYKSIIEKFNKEITTLEEKINSAPNDLYGPAITLFHAEKFSEKLSEIKDNFNKLLSNEKQCPKCGFDNIDETDIGGPFKLFQANYENKIKEIIEVSEKFISTEFGSIIKKLEDHKEKLEGKNPIGLRNKLINFIFKTATKEKIRLEEQGIHTLDKVKIYIADFSSSRNNNTDTLKKYYDELDSIFKNKSFTKHRGCLFFRFNPTTSESIANNAIKLVEELKSIKA